MGRTAKAGTTSINNIYQLHLRPEAAAVISFLRRPRGISGANLNCVSKSQAVIGEALVQHLMKSLKFSNEVVPCKLYKNENVANHAKQLGGFHDG